WGKKRVEKIRRYVDLMLVLFPFEQKFYRQHGIIAHYVGHPLVDYHQPYLPREFKTVTPGAAVLGLLPGSRVNEVRALLPRMAQTARLLKKRGAIKKAEIIRAAQIDESLYRTILPDQTDWLSLVQKPLYRALPEYDAAMVASGTATLETALYAVPMLIVYHVHALTYWLGKRLVKIPNIGLANIVAETPIAKEMIQHEFQPPAAAAYLEQILQPEQNRQIREKSLIIREKLGKPGASRRAAEIIDRFLPAS
ncbi:MAG TPA: lipid-A-disaccharide synthase, partial [Caldithrix abyssi]|nr:lipid-A-disaccharide synthase [Caldithrix abyssi]